MDSKGFLSNTVATNRPKCSVYQKRNLTQPASFYGLVDLSIRACLLCDNMIFLSCILEQTGPIGGVRLRQSRLGLKTTWHAKKPAARSLQSVRVWFCYFGFALAPTTTREVVHSLCYRVILPAFLFPSKIKDLTTNMTKHFVIQRLWQG